MFAKIFEVQLGGYGADKRRKDGTASVLVYDGRLVSCSYQRRAAHHKLGQMLSDNIINTTAPVLVYDGRFV